MRKANRNTVNDAIYKQLAEVQMSHRDRKRAANFIRTAEVFADAIVWLRDRIASLGAMVLRPGFKH